MYMITKTECKQAEKIVEETLLKGGYTHSINGRYVVAVNGFTKIIPLKDFNALEVASYIKRQCADEIGTWVHKGNVYLDIVECYDDKNTALKVAKKRDELAIFDIKEFKEIKV